MNIESIKFNLLRIGKYGQDETGAVTRLLFSEAYQQASQELIRYMEEAGMRTWVDRIGNIHGIYSGDNDDDKTILLGSHLDTVKNGGLFDGLLGVITSIECVREFNEQNIKLDHNIEVVAFNAEEGNILGGTFGSRCVMGLIDTSDEELLNKASTFNLTKEDLEGARMNTESIDCYLELHIEQGNTLEKRQKDIGVVNGIVGLQRYEISIKGVHNHSGTTMMENRKDALVELSKLIVKIDELARRYGNNLVATVNDVKISPNVLGVITGEVECVLEIRNLDHELMEEFIKEISNYLKGAGGFESAISKIISKQPVDCHPQIVAIMDDICKENTMSYEIMPSGATHDANAMAERMPVGMIFVPSKDGISHSKDEYTKWEHITVGAELLYKTILKIDQVEF